MNIQNLTLKNYYGFTLKATYKGEKEPKCCNDNRSRSHTHHVITVKNNETGKKLHFDFWNSVLNPQITSTQELKDAFQCYLNDCLVAMETYEEFISEFGYDDDKDSKRVYKECQCALKKLERIYDGDILELYNAVNGW